MKILVQYLILILSGVGSLVSAQTEQIVRNASVRIIRYEDLDDALNTLSQSASQEGSASVQLPASHTGFLIHKHPVDEGNNADILTTYYSALSSDENFDDPLKKPSYLVLLPLYNSENRVVGVRAYNATLQKVNKDPQTAILCTAPYKLPPVVKATEHPLKVQDAVTVIGFKQYIPNDGQAIVNILNDLKILRDNLRGHDNAYMELTAEGTNQHESLMAYMGVSQTPCNVSQLSADTKPSRRIELSTSLDDDSLGSAILNARSDYLVGVFVDRNGSIPGACDYKSAGVELEMQLPWMWIGIGAAVLLIIGGLVVVIVRKSGKNRKSSKPVLRLHGEDGSWHVVSSSQLRHGVTIGRSSQANLTFSHDSISRIHALLSVLEGRVVIIDKESKGGTFVNGEQLNPGQPRKLHDGDELKLSAFKVKVETLQHR